ncbi:MAG: N-6 DNA methylase [Chloroflexi bacterium]|nr:N-6 DNA methylase [Chloroflexota bacterium]
MLDVDTKARIDSARDILVGKVPDPKSQVEQITLALIYKFMDDMDRQSEDLGGVASFFAGDYKQYAWANLLDRRLGGEARLDLYVRGLASMERNPNIPQLFRDIFKGAFLPYRDPETLNLFLKEIDGFTYDHSERLGDAFEYLLSVLGSQGAAGQFRTPRHIIDFIVRIVDPQKGESILDPACGTAGFLISAYKHILAANADQRPGDRLTGAERHKLMTDFVGYDISPDMVRLSRANLYLHGFPNPRIAEYDTLTSEERWADRFDVIMANPPFMSPKGGIRPHSRFAIQASRSEVLFVDYIAEHLLPSGRAGVIVPEGIIFQSQTAYKALRKMLVEGYLWAVVSLPGGVFNPYSGVKTSILLLDKRLARERKEVLFVKVSADGYDLGAQRRPVERDDLPEAARAIAAWRATHKVESAIAHAVPRQRILDSADVGLSGDRYVDNGRRVSAKWPMVQLEDVCDINPESVNPTAAHPKQTIFYIDISSIENGTGRFLGYTEVPSTDAPSRARRCVQVNDVLLSTVRPNLRAFTLLREVHERAVASTGFAVLRAKQGILEAGYLFEVVRSENAVAQMIGMMGKGAYPSINQTDVASIHIPLPPLGVQREIVAELDGYRKVIEGARQVLASYKPTIKVDSGWERVEIRQIGRVESGFGFPLERQGSTDEEIPFLKVSDMNLPANETVITTWNNSVSRETLRELHAKAFPAGTVIFPKIGAAIATNKKRILGQESTYDNNVIGIVPDSDLVDPRYLYTYLLGFDISHWASDAQPPSMRKTVVEAHKLPLPPLDIQRQIVAELEAERALVEGNRALIERMEHKVQARLAEVWGEAAD